MRTGGNGAARLQSSGARRNGPISTSWTTRSDTSAPPADTRQAARPRAAPAGRAGGRSAPRTNRMRSRKPRGSSTSSSRAIIQSGSRGGAAASSAFRFSNFPARPARRGAWLASPRLRGPSAPSAKDTVWRLRRSSTTDVAPSCARRPAGRGRARVPCPGRPPCSGRSRRGGTSVHPPSGGVDQVARERDRPPPRRSRCRSHLRGAATVGGTRPSPRATEQRGRGRRNAP